MSHEDSPDLELLRQRIHAVLSDATGDPTRVVPRWALITIAGAAVVSSTALALVAVSLDQSR